MVGGGLHVIQEPRGESSAGGAGGERARAVGGQRRAVGTQADCLPGGHCPGRQGPLDSQHHG